MYRIAVIDDNVQFLETLRQIVTANPEFTVGMVCEAFSGGKEFLEEMDRGYHLVITDMQMDGLDGYQTALKIRERDRDTVIAFISGVVLPQPEHFEAGPCRYLLKTFDTEKLQKGITELLREMRHRYQEERIEVVSDGQAWRILPEDILYVSKAKRGSRLHLRDAETKESCMELQSNERLREWYAQLYEYGFEFAHSSYIVNMQQITGIIKDDIVLSNGELLRISRTCRNKFHERFSCCFGKKYRRDRLK